MQTPPNRLAVSLNHSELALLYFADNDKESASRKLTTWLKNDKQLMQALRQTGHRSGQKYFTPKQLLIIFDHLGLPAPPDLNQ